MLDSKRMFSIKLFKDCDYRQFSPFSIAKFNTFIHFRAYYQLHYNKYNIHKVFEQSVLSLKRCY